jgi:hypothetical protein
VRAGLSLRRVSLPVLAALLFAYLLFIRTRHVTQSFWLLGDQILYWKMALGSWRDLPAGGGPTSVGGTTLGPVFVWTIWIIGRVVGPWTDNLPHAGSVGLSILHSAADALLFVAIARRFESIALGLATILVVVSAPYDLAFNATIWNPPLAVAFVKTSLAIVLLAHGRASVWWAAAATAAALLAAQAHSSAIFVVVPVAASFVVRELAAGRRTGAWQTVAALAAIVLLLEIPYLVNLMTASVATRPTLVVRSVSDTLAEPQRLRPGASLAELASALQFILLRPWTFRWFGVLLGACAAIFAYRARNDVTLVGATLGPMLCAVIGFSFWQQAYDHYWFLTIAPGAALIMTVAVTTAWKNAAGPVGWLLVVLAIVSQPWRVADAMTFHRMPEYGLLVDGSREIRRRTNEVQAIDTDFALPASTDPSFLYVCLGGRVRPQASLIATIHRMGEATFRPARAE